MTEIPDDVLNAAKQVAFATEERGEDDAAITSHIGVRVICEAILAERERCTEIAMKMSEQADSHEGSITADMIAGKIEVGA